MAQPIHVTIDLPVQVAHSEHNGFAYEHRFTAEDRDYDIGTAAGELTVWRDPARRTVMLRPAQLTDTFMQTDIGLFQRLRLESYHTDAGEVSEDWESVNYRFDGDIFLLAKTTNVRLNTSKKWEPNQGFFLRVFAYGQYGRRDTLLVFEWGKPEIGEDSDAQYKMTLTADGSFTLEKNGAEVFNGNLTPGERDKGTLQQKYFELMILPYRRNEILFWTSLGAYDVYVDYDYVDDPTDEEAPSPTDPNGAAYVGRTGYGSINETDNVICEFGHAAITFPNAKGWFQLSPLVYHCNASGQGTIDIRVPVLLPYKPDEAEFPEGGSATDEIDRDLPSGCGVTFASNLTLDGTDEEMAWQMTLIGHRPDSDLDPLQASRTPFVYGFSYVLPAGVQETPDETNEITDNVRALTRRFSEDGATCDMEIKDPSLLDPYYFRALHRTVRVYRDIAGEQDELFYGVATEPDYDEWPASPDGIDHTPVMFRVSDHWERFEKTQLKGFRALDGMTLSDAVREILKKVGWDMARTDIGENTFRLPQSPKDEEKLILTDNVGSAKDLLLYLRDEYTTSELPPYRWIMDFAPVIREGEDTYTICFCFTDPATLADAEAPAALRTLYGTQAAAIAAGRNKDSWVRSYRRRILEPEANWIIVFGETPDGNSLYAEKYDPLSIDNTLAIAARPDNWLGFVREFVYYNPALNTQALVNRACDAWYNRLVKPRYIAEWEAEGLYNDRLWDRHMMTHDSNRRYSLREFSTEHVLETAALTVRPTLFTGEARD